MNTYRIYVEQVETFFIEVQAESKEDALAQSVNVDFEDYESTGELVLQDAGIDVRTEDGDFLPA